MEKFKVFQVSSYRDYEETDYRFFHCSEAAWKQYKEWAEPFPRGDSVSLVELVPNLKGGFDAIPMASTKRPSSPNNPDRKRLLFAVREDGEARAEMLERLVNELPEWEVVDLEEEPHPEDEFDVVLFKKHPTDSLWELFPLDHKLPDGEASLRQAEDFVEWLLDQLRPGGLCLPVSSSRQARKMAAERAAKKGFLAREGFPLSQLKQILGEYVRQE